MHIEKYTDSTRMLKASIRYGLLAAGLSLTIDHARAETDPKTLPLLQQSDIEFVGSFALPIQTSGTSRFGYGGQGITPYNDSATGKKTLFIGGNLQKAGQIAQVEIPAKLSKSATYTELPVATFVQPFNSIVDGDLKAKAGITTGDGGMIYGMLAYRKKLIVAVAEYYGCTQKYTHGASDLDLTEPTDFKGFYKISALADVRAIGGPMAPVPAAWQSLMGGSAITGNWGIPLVGCTSAGPSITAFNPDDIVSGNGTQGSTLLYYPYVNPLCVGATCTAKDPTSTQNEMYNLTTRLGGVAFPEGSRSVLFFGRHGVGNYCYGLADCQGGVGDPAESDGKGPHAFPYRFQIWAYDANDLLKVKAGTIKSYEPKPYGIWAMKEMDAFYSTGQAKINGAGYDPETRRWFITREYAEKPRVDVYMFHAATGSSGIKSGRSGSAPMKVSVSQGALASAVTLEVPGFAVGSGEPLHYRIYDNSGRKVKDLESSSKDGRVVWDAASQAPGVYVVKSDLNQRSLVNRITLKAGLR